MIINIPEADDIYFAKTREYFQEVLSSYASGNYRSAVVMLYSVAICDMLFKLQELRDMYNDTIADTILSEVEKSKNANDNKSKSKWEKEFVDNVYTKTELLDLESYTHLNHLYDYRNFSAHPALNENYELISPTKEITIACIKNTLEDILVKPPIFIKKVVDMLTEDLDGKYELYQNDNETLANYLNNKYYTKMGNPMRLSTFRSLWKICFICTDEKCTQNRSINRSALSVLYKGNPALYHEEIKNNQDKYSVAFQDNCILYLVGFVANNTLIYKYLNDETKLMIEQQINQNKNDSLVCWYKYDKYSDYFNYILTLGFVNIKRNTADFMTKFFLSSGEKDSLLSYFIVNYAVSTSYEASKSVFDITIKPNLSKMTREHLLSLIGAVNNNRQNYERWYIKGDNTEIVKQGIDYLGKDFDLSQYPNFKFDETVLEDIDVEDTEREIFE